MNPAQSFAGAFKGGGNSLDAPVGALAGLAVAFAVFAMPSDLLGRLVEATGLAAIVPAAEPPLGMDARILVGAAGAVLAFALVFALLRGIDRLGARRADRAEAFDAEESEPPRRRRRDLHPDAPARPPLLAGCELGEPSFHSEPEPEPAPESEAILELESELESEPELLLRRKPERADWIPDAAEAEAGVAPQPVPESAPAPDAASPAEPPPPLGSSIPDLMERLERGLARRRVSPPPPSAPADPPAAFPEAAADDRLRSAIESLQRLAQRQA